jgi:hypothetical protein
MGSQTRDLVAGAVACSTPTGASHRRQKNVGEAPPTTIAALARAMLARRRPEDTASRVLC